MKYLYFLCLLLIVPLGLSAQGNTRTIKGSVYDSHGESVIGASIKEKDGKGLTITDIDGKFTVNVSSDPKTVLIVSYLGYKAQEVKLDGTNELHIVLEENSHMLDELVVIGYGTQKKSALTSSIETVSAADIIKMPTPNLDEALAGQVAGLSVSSLSGDPSSARESKIRIRGINNNPLLVIDGIPRFAENTTDGEMRLSDLNPDDIESISVLKDAAAAAVYGSRAARGVILVTTKRGQGEKKVRVNYRGQINLQKATKFPEFLDAFEYAKLYNHALSNSAATFQNRYKPYTDEQLEIIRTNASPNEYGNENLIDHLKNHGYSTSHSLSISGGGKDINYYTSLGYTKTEGLYSGVGRERYNYSIKLDANLMTDLKLMVDVLGTRTENKNSSYTTIDAAFDLDPTQVLQYTDGRLASINSGNPLIAARGLGGYIENHSNMNSISATLKYNASWLKGLSAYAKTTFDYNTFKTKIFSKPVTLYMPDKNNPELIVEDPKTVYPSANPQMEKGKQDVTNTLVEFGLNYANKFAGKHDVTGLLVANYQRNNRDLLTGNNNRMGGFYPEIIGVVTGEDAKISGMEETLQRASLIGRGTYSFDSRYFFESSFRYDGSTRLHPDNRWKFFPSVSASWVMTNEDFFKYWKQDVISNVKFRTSAGILGDENTVPNYSYQMRYILSPQEGYWMTDSYNPSVIASPDAFPNIDIEYEKRKSYNVATDIGFWDNRFGITYEYYWRFRTNMLEVSPAYLYPPSAGAGGRYPYINMGKIKEWGWDLTINHRNTIDKVRYNVDFMISKTDNKYLNYGDESAQLPNRRKAGNPAYNWSVYQADGLFQTQEEIDNHPLDQDGKGNTTLAPGDIKYKDMNGDDKLTKEDMIYVRNAALPEYTYSIKVGAEYKGFFFNALFQGVEGYKQLLTEQYTLHNKSLQKFQTYHKNESWTEENRNARYPRLKFSTVNDNNRQESTFWIEDCNYIRLKSLNIGYAVPAKIAKKMLLSSLNVSFQASNLFTWSSLKNMDPESLRGYPIQKTYGMSLNIGF